MKRLVLPVILLLSIHGAVCKFRQAIFHAGVDLSHYNNVTDWSMVGTNGIRFAIIKGTEGPGYVDPTFEEKWTHLGKLGIIPGVYHFYRSDHSPEENFANVKKHVLDKVNFTQEQHFAVDFETNPGGLKPEKLAQDLYKFLQLAENELHFKPIIYTYALFWNKNLEKHQHSYPFHSYRLWIAHYEVLQPNMPEAWPDFYIWQFTSSGYIKGIHGHVDLNWWKP